MTRQKRLGHLLAEVMSHGAITVMHSDDIDDLWRRHCQRRVRTFTRNASAEYRMRTGA